VETSRDELYRVFDRSPIGMYRTLEDGRFLYANPALARLLGYDLAELLLLNLKRDIYIDGRQREELIKNHRAEGVVDGARVDWRHRDGRRIVVRIYGHVVDHPGTETSFDATVIDVTESEVQLEELERTALTLNLVVRQMPATWWVIDTDLRILRSGGAVMEMFGYAPDTYLGHTLDEVLATEPMSTSDSIGVHRRALAGETAMYQNEYRGRQVSYVVAPYRRDGKIVGAIGSCIDVTAQRALERRMVDAQRAESLGVLAGGLAHDFNNLLVAILGNADLGLRDTPRGTPGYTALANVRAASLRAAELTDQLLAYAGRRGVASTRVNAKPLVDELLRIVGPTIPPQVKVEADIQPHLAVRGDHAQVLQVFLNLITNARDALNERGGTIAITTRFVAHDGTPLVDDVLTAPPGQYVQIEISDNGPGIDRETRRRVFDPFFTTKPAGHGLGLAAVLGIVRAHEGGIRLASTEGEGARFTVLWPSAPSSGDLPALTMPVAPPVRSVLVIDDEDLVRDVVARMVEDLGYAVVTAADGQTGLALADERVFDAALVDMTMPRMNGAEVVAALRVRHPALKVILCTGYDRDRKGPVAADAYLPKPFRIEALESTLAKLLH